jgi:hypothetical protein
MDVQQLEALLSAHPNADDVQDLLSPAAWDEKAYDRQRKEKKRALDREIHIPPPKNLELRNRCLQDFELLLVTYFPDIYDEAFTEDRSDMLSSIVWAATYGGDKAIAGSRGEGKTTLALDGAMCLMLKRLNDFPVVIGKNQDSSSEELKALREKMVSSERFIEDFPEIGVPMDLAGPGVASPKQMVGGKYIRLFMGAKYFAFPTITIAQLPHWDQSIVPVSCGQVMGALGINGRIRGEKFRGKRPRLAIIDDIEDTQAAGSDTLIAKNEKKIEEDIGGLGRSSKRIARVMLCTIQNRKCIAFKYTDPKQKQSWNGKRYRKMKKPPDRMDLVADYIEMRKMRKQDDPDAREAFRYWRDNQDEIEAGCEVSNKQSYNSELHFDGEQIELSAIQAYYNRVADMGEKAVATEIDNDPPEEVGPQGMGLTAEIVASRINGLSRLQLPANASALTVGIDVGKYRCHWTATAWWEGAGGCVVDYGVLEVSGNDGINSGDRAADMVASEPAIYRALLSFRDEMLTKEYVDATGTRRKIDMVMIDSGTYTNAVYEFVRQVRGVWHPSKGIANYRPRAKSTEVCRAGKNQHAQWMEAAKVWLYELDTDHWKQWVHERFLTPSFDEQNMLRRGSLSIYEPIGKQKHTSYAQHIVAEELLTEFKEGKGVKTYWHPRNDNNHWLDATYLAAACTESMGIALITPSECEIAPRHVDASKPKPAVNRARQHGNRFRTRPGGWVQGARKR